MRDETGSVLSERYSVGSWPNWRGWNLNSTRFFGFLCWYPFSYPCITWTRIRREVRHDLLKLSENNVKNKFNCSTLFEMSKFFYCVTWPNYEHTEKKVIVWKMRYIIFFTFYFCLFIYSWKLNFPERHAKMPYKSVCSQKLVYFLTQNMIVFF